MPRYVCSPRIVCEEGQRKAHSPGGACVGSPVRERVGIRAPSEGLENGREYTHHHEPEINAFVPAMCTLGRGMHMHGESYYVCRDSPAYIAGIDVNKLVVPA